ncbi:MAG: flap endonuclease [Nitrospirota bacterium]|nr:flap endonuclease [Nitrospirota bacterium]
MGTGRTLKIHLIDGTYELFRHYYALPSAKDQDGFDLAAVRGVLASVLGMIKNGATHIGVATDHVIESFRNSLWPGYKTGEGIEPALLAQFHFLEEVLSAAGIVVWPMVEFEADDALASAALAAARDTRVEQVVICTPDKDLSQCVQGNRIVQLNRRRRVVAGDSSVVPSPIPIPVGLTATRRVKMEEDAWNSRDPERGARLLAGFGMTQSDRIHSRARRKQSISQAESINDAEIASGERRAL